MILNSIIISILDIVTNLVSLIIAPINALIISYFPNLNTILSAIDDYLELTSSSFSYSLSLIMLSPTVWAIIIAFYVVRLTLPLSLYVIKLILNWYDKLKP